MDKKEELQEGGSYFKIIINNNLCRAKNFFTK